MPVPDAADAGLGQPRLILEERSYDSAALQRFVDARIPLLNEGQRSAYDDIMAARSAPPDQVCAPRGACGEASSLCFSEMAAMSLTLHWGVAGARQVPVWAGRHRQDLRGTACSWRLWRAEEKVVRWRWPPRALLPC